jgi:hypothetical protein
MESSSDSKDKDTKDAEVSDKLKKSVLIKDAGGGLKTCFICVANAVWGPRYFT